MTQIESDEEWTAKVTRFGVEEPDPELGEESFDDSDINVASPRNSIG